MLTNSAETIINVHQTYSTAVQNMKTQYVHL